MDYSKITLLKNKHRSTIDEMATILDVTKSGYYYVINNQTLTVKQLEGLARFYNVPITFFFSAEEQLKASENAVEYNIKKSTNYDNFKFEIEILKRMISEKDKTISELNREIGKLMNSNS